MWREQAGVGVGGVCVYAVGVCVGGMCVYVCVGLFLARGKMGDLGRGCLGRVLAPDRSYRTRA